MVYIVPCLADLKDKHKKLPTNMLLLMTELEHEGPVYTNKMLITISGGEDKGLVYEAEAQASLLDIIQNSFLNNQGKGRVVHRLAIFDAYGAVQHIVSQLDVIR